ncbi:MULTISPECIES: Ig-like domain-containing protein [Bacillus]|uniref:Ig-like domain-containing protein n=1 Tax=Bacillus TaxID=1386 RepID=UPI001F352AAB|nr:MULTISPECIES: Ig-like domain-containing protein [Bacillus]
MSGGNISLPESVKVTYNNGDEGSAVVTWDQKALKRAIKKGVGEYVIEGVVKGGKTVLAHLKILC